MSGFWEEWENKIKDKNFTSSLDFPSELVGTHSFCFTRVTLLRSPGATQWRPKAVVTRPCRCAGPARTPPPYSTGHRSRRAPVCTPVRGPSCLTTCWTPERYHLCSLDTQNAFKDCHRSIMCQHIFSIIVLWMKLLISAFKIHKYLWIFNHLNSSFND